MTHSPYPPLTLSLQWARDLSSSHPQAWRALRDVLPRYWVHQTVWRALCAAYDDGLTSPHAQAQNTPQAFEITVRMVTSGEAQQLNRSYRGKDYATNVLTFNYARTPVVLADLVLCVPVLAQEATALNKPLKDHALHLLVHGTLHAMGYDHEQTEYEARHMEALEIAVLKGLGIANPYIPDAA